MSRRMNRRRFMGTIGLGGLAAMTWGPRGFAAEVMPAGGGSGEYTLPPLPYAYDALQPYLSKDLLTLHHDKHHAAYVKGLNAALAKAAAARLAGDQGAIQSIAQQLAFHGSGHVLHSLYWENMAPKAGGTPKGDLAKQIDRDFGSFDAFKAQFAAATKAVEGSGWGLLVWEPLGKRLLVLQCEKHQNLTIWGCAPLLICDVWEHAYYLDYKNDRPTYVDKFFDVVNWEKVSERLAAAKK